MRRSCVLRAGVTPVLLMILELTKDDFTVSTDPARLDLDSIYAFLSRTYWARHRPRHVFEEAVRNSLCFGLYDQRAQIGFARVITDRATFGYLADVYVLESHRRRGLGQWLVESILAHPELKDLRRWCLLTRDMHPLYEKCGFVSPEHPDHYMERLKAYANEGELE